MLVDGGAESGFRDLQRGTEMYSSFVVVYKGPTTRVRKVRKGSETGGSNGGVLKMLSRQAGERERANVGPCRVAG